MLRLKGNTLQDNLSFSYSETSSEVMTALMGDEFSKISLQFF